MSAEAKEFKHLEKLLVSSSPHIRSPESTARIMWTVVATLVPATAVGVVVFGWRALIVILLSVGTAVLCEYVIQRARKVTVRIADGSAVVTGLLVAMVLPPTVAWYVPVVGAVVAIGLAKHLFGGLGNNIWNPALVGRAFCHVTFSQQMNSGWNLLRPSRLFVGDVLNASVTGEGVDAVSRATPLGLIHQTVTGTSDQGVSTLAEVLSLSQTSGGLVVPPPQHCLLGYMNGCIGEGSVIALVLGGLFLIYRGYVKWYVPALYIGTVAALAALLPVALAADPASGVGTRWIVPLLGAEGPGVGLTYVSYHLICGGLMLGAFFMATDMVTTPITRKGLIIFAVGCGVLTILLRTYGGYPEGVCFSILLMNTATPVIDRLCKPRVYGT
jgi:electron transport complex protein RnfD